MADDKVITVSSNWNGMVYTAHATDGTKFGSASGQDEEAVKAAAVKDMEGKRATTDAPVQGGDAPTPPPVEVTKAR